MSKKFRLLALALLAALVLSCFAGCGQTNEWVVQLGDTKVESGVYLGYLVSNYNNAKSEAGFGYSSDISGLWDKKIDEKSVEQWVLDKTLEDCYAYVGVSKWFDELGLTLSKTDNDTIQNNTDQSWSQMQSMLEKNGCSKASLKKIVTATQKERLIFEKLYEKDGERAVPEAEINKYFADNFTWVRMLSAPLYDTETYQSLSGTELTELENEFKGMAGRVANGADLLEVIKAYEKANTTTTNSVTTTTTTAATTTTTAATTTTTSASTTSGSTTGTTATGDQKEEEQKTYLQLVDKVSGNFSDELTDVVFKLKVGETAYAKDSYAVYVVQRQAASTDGLSDNRTAILSSLRYDEFEKELTEKGKKLGVTKNDAAIRRFSVKNIEDRFVSEEVSA